MYSIVWESCVKPAAGALDDGWIEWLHLWKLDESVRAECVVTI